MQEYTKLFAEKQPENSPRKAPKRKTPAKSSTNRRWLIAAVAVIAVISVGVGVWLLTTSSKKDYDDSEDKRTAMIADPKGEWKNDTTGLQRVLDIEEEEEEEWEIEEEVSAIQQITELRIIDEVEGPKEVKDVAEILEDQRAVGVADVEGISDLNKAAVQKEVVEERPRENYERKKEEGPVSMAIVEMKPLFPGGDKAMYEWLTQNMVYPPSAAADGAQGKVFVQFIVEKDGSISHVQIARGRHPALDEEAKRVVKKMPRWTPGRNNGEPVRVTYLLPVNFSMQMQ